MEGVITTPNMLKTTGRMALAYFIADPHCGGIKLYELYLSLVAYPPLYTIYQKRYGESTEQRITQIRSMNKRLLQLALLSQQLEKLYKRFTSFGEKDSRLEKLNPVITTLSKKIWTIAGQLEPLHYMLTHDTMFLLYHCDVGQQVISQAYVSMARSDTLNFRTDQQTKGGLS